VFLIDNQYFESESQVYVRPVYESNRGAPGVGGIRP